MANEKLRQPCLNQPVKDLLALGIALAVVLALSYFFDAFSAILHYSQKHPEQLTYIDEVLVGFFTLSTGLAVFSWRRWRELKKEAQQRLRHQEELLRITTTQAETERIISKQLRLDMDQMKQDVRDMLLLLRSKNRPFDPPR